MDVILNICKHFMCSKFLYVDFSGSSLFSVEWDFELGGDQVEDRN